MNLNELEALNEPCPYVCDLFKFNAAANPETILTLIALLREMGEALRCVAYDEEGYIMNADAEEVYAKYEEMINRD